MKKISKYCNILSIVGLKSFKIENLYFSECSAKIQDSLAQMANSWNFDGKPVLWFEVRERNTIFMMVTEFRRYNSNQRNSREEKFVVSSSCHGKIPSIWNSFPSVVKKHFTVSQNGVLHFDALSFFYHHAYARSMFDLFTNRYHTYS